MDKEELENKDIIEEAIKKVIKRNKIEIIYYSKSKRYNERNSLYKITSKLKENLNNILKIEISYKDILCRHNRLNFLVMHIKVYKGKKYSDTAAELNDIIIVNIVRDKVHYKFRNDMAVIFRGRITENRINEQIVISEL